jgi:hypothetical protein
MVTEIRRVLAFEGVDCLEGGKKRLSGVMEMLIFGVFRSYMNADYNNNNRT